MRFFIENIGMVKQADVEINGITVIAGLNNTGKSTVGKSLFALFNSIYRINDQMDRDRFEMIWSVFRYAVVSGKYRQNIMSGLNALAQKFVDKRDYYSNNVDLIKKEIEDCLKKQKKDDLTFDSVFSDNDITRIVEALRISDEEIMRHVLEKRFNAEFYGQVNNIYSEQISNIELVIKNNSFKITIDNNKVVNTDGLQDLRTEIVYIDDPFVVDETGIQYLFRSGDYDHRAHLIDKLYGETKEKKILDEIIVNKKLDSIYEKIGKAFDADIVHSKELQNSVSYVRTGTHKKLDIKSLSTGSKTFAIIKMLLQNGTIEYNGTIVLDEPEIHLHPEWQMLFAEIIVLLQREFSVHMLINTHSPYFINAIETYSKKYQIESKCKYYFAEIESTDSVIRDVTDDLEVIYRTLAQPLQLLENERYMND